MSSTNAVLNPLGDVGRVAPKQSFGRVRRADPNVRPARMSRSKDILRTSLFAYVIIGISQFHLLWPSVAAFRPALIAIAVVAGIAYLNPSLLASGSLFRTWQGKAIAALFCIGCLSIPFGISLGNAALFFIDGYWKTILFAVLILYAIRNARDLYTLCWAFLLAAGVLAWVVLFKFDVTDFGEYARLDSMYSYDGNDVGCILVSGVGVALLLFRTSVRPIARASCLVILVMLCAALAKSGSRGAFLAMLAVGIAIILFDRGAGLLPRLLQIGIAALAVSTFAPHGYWTRMEGLLTPKEDYNYAAVDGRRMIAKRGIQYMMAYPVFGVGLNNFHKAECSIADKARNYVPGVPIFCKSPHNSYIQAGAELGIPGMILWSSLILGGIIAPLYRRSRLPAAWRRRGDAEERFLYAAGGLLPVTMAGFAVSSFFLTFAWSDIAFFLIALTTSYEVAVRAKLRDNIIHPPPPVPIRQTGASWRSMKPAPV